MQKTDILLSAIGKLVVSLRSVTMDQTELGQRVGVGRNTISSIENGKAVNAETLFNVLEHLGVIEDFQEVVEQRLAQQTTALSRKSRKDVQELNNDF
ncbi:helix-turn-helix transcriptional regulator [Alteromonas australica]|uniref:helix-turn-helix transcriptional regulator n=1 Tax=Alteromonas australica TaxID=589873 RepID=UPI002356384D|nr:helix-turn-helix transcriptional regulator [Alteromonas australica]